VPDPRHQHLRRADRRL